MIDSSTSAAAGALFSTTRRRDLIPIPIAVREAERAGFEVLDLEALRDHYAETLRRWLDALERRFDEAVHLVGRERARTWRLYLASSALAFEVGTAGIYQLLLVKQRSGPSVTRLPRCHGKWYDGLQAV